MPGKQKRGRGNHIGCRNDRDATRGAAGVINPMRTASGQPWRAERRYRLCRSPSSETATLSHFAYSAGVHFLVRGRVLLAHHQRVAIFEDYGRDRSGRQRRLGIGEYESTDPSSQPREMHRVCSSRSTIRSRAPPCECRFIRSAAKRIDMPRRSRQGARPGELLNARRAAVGKSPRGVSGPRSPAARSPSARGVKDESRRAAHEEIVVRNAAKPRQHVTHRRLAEPDILRGARDVTSTQQRLEGGQQVEIDGC